MHRAYEVIVFSKTNVSTFLIAFVLSTVLSNLITYIFISILKYSVVYNCVPASYKPTSYVLGVLLLVPLSIFISLHFIEKPSKQRIALGAWGVVCAGGFGNAIELLLNGCVRDYINFLGLFHNNVFDFFVVGGLIMITFFIFSKNIFK